MPNMPMRGFSTRFAVLTMGNSPEHVSSLLVHSPSGFSQRNWPEEARDRLSWKHERGRTDRFHVRSQRVVDCDVQLVLTRTKMAGQVEDIRRPDAYPDEFPVDMDLCRSAHPSQIKQCACSGSVCLPTYQRLTIAHPAAVADQPLLLPGADLHRPCSRIWFRRAGRTPVAAQLAARD